MMSGLIRCSIGLMLGALLLSGCGKSPPAIVPAQGIVLVEGVPLPSVKVDVFLFVSLIANVSLSLPAQPLVPAGQLLPPSAPVP